MPPVVKRELNTFLAFVKKRDAGLDTDKDMGEEPVKATVWPSPSTAWAPRPGS